MPKRSEKLPRYYQRREDNGLLRVRIQVPAREHGFSLREQIVDFQPKGGRRTFFVTSRLPFACSGGNKGAGGRPTNCSDVGRLSSRRPCHVSGTKTTCCSRWGGF
jgi:hypothetical protein